MADTLSRKLYGRNALRSNFQKILEEARSCINDPKATQAKYLGLQNNIDRLCKGLNEIDEEIFAILEPENIENDVSESMNIMEPVHEILAEITLKLEKIRFKDSEQSSVKSNNVISNTKLPKLEFQKYTRESICCELKMLRWSHDHHSSSLDPYNV